MRRSVGALVVLLALAVPRLAVGDGEPTAELSDTGILVPINERRADVLDQRIAITLPKRNTAGPPDPALVRVEYILRSQAAETLQLAIGWATGGAYVGPSKPPRRCLPYIKLDGKPVAYNYLTFDDLADPYVDQWMTKMDELLESKPAVQEQVLAIREQGSANGRRWLAQQGVNVLADWMRGVGRPVSPDPADAETVAAGLLGVTPWGYAGRRDEFARRALRWLDPTHEEISVYDLLSERWSHDTRLLDPESGQLYDTRAGMLTHEPTFAVFRFSIALRPHQKHRLVVQYGQYLGYADGWNGLAYLMEPAERWGYWKKTTIEIKVPTGWKTVAIRPPAKKVATAGGFTTYRIAIPGRPCENLYVSVQ